ncbi:MAG TPA: AAC(3) family N-acetyltransferase [Pyrinomonadaceae bacterium]|nr:AAC(3) family N-acetyltransferase [Pyrinomonadaceae bacterium]
MSAKGLKKILPRSLASLLRRARQKYGKAKVSSLPALTEDDFTSILVKQLRLIEGDTVFIHSSVDQLNLTFSYGRILPLVRSVIGESGTMLFPTYPKLGSYEFLSRGETFDVRRTPSFMGILTEFARRQRDAVRSLHPVKSVAAIGRLARELTATHQQSPYPFDICSPYRKIIEHGGKIVGFGVSTARMSFVHCADDALKDDFPVRPYHEQLFAARCINYDGDTEIVETFAHDLSKMNHDIPRYVRRHISGAACTDLSIGGMKFYRADAGRLFDEMVRLAREGVTIYPRSAYPKKS